MDAEKLLKHMAWANQSVIGQLKVLPDEALDAYLVNPEWTAREISRHIASSATWYGWRLLDKSNFTDEDNAAWQAKLDETEIPARTSAEVQKVLDRLTAADQVLFEAARLPEGTIVREWQGKTITRARSTVISQAIHHATEHRSQLVAALEARGYTSINLDDFDLWNYCDKFGE